MKIICPATRFYSASALIGALLLGFATSSSAALVVGTMDDPVKPVIGDSNYVGRIAPGSPASESDEVDYINFLITLDPGDTVPPGTPPHGQVLYDRTSGIAGPFASAVLAGSTRDESGNTMITITTPVLYILGKYDASAAGDFVWYFPMGVTGVVTLPAELLDRGLSHITTFNPVPEASSLLVWCGMGLVGLCVFRRRLRS